MCASREQFPSRQLLALLCCILLATKCSAQPSGCNIVHSFSSWMLPARDIVAAPRPALPGVPHRPLPRQAPAHVWCCAAFLEAAHPCAACLHR